VGANDKQILLAADGVKRLDRAGLAAKKEAQSIDSYTCLTNTLDVFRGRIRLKFIRRQLANRTRVAAI
jgi:hypothetical protein